MFSTDANVFNIDCSFVKIANAACTEGLAVGVGFGAIGKTPSSTFAKAR